MHAERNANHVAKEFGLHATTVAKWVCLSPMGMPAAVPPAKSNVPLGLLNAAERQIRVGFTEEAGIQISEHLSIHAIDKDGKKTELYDSDKSL